MLNHGSSQRAGSPDGSGVSGSGSHHGALVHLVLVLEQTGVRGPRGDLGAASSYRILLVLAVLISLLRLLLSLHFDLHGVADQGSEDGDGL